MMRLGLFVLHFTVCLLLPSLALADCIILLHGLARSERSFSKMEKVLVSRDYIVVNNGYPSREYTIESLAEPIIRRDLLQCEKYMQKDTSSKVHFVTHSMGGILLRYYLKHHKVPNLGRVVMLGPPNKGSEVVDKLSHFPGFKFLNGEAGIQLGTDTGSFVHQLGAADFDVGIIAGTRSINLILSQIIPGKDDGKVSIENTKLEGMAQHLVLPVTHTFMMKNKKVIAEVLHYLESGEFSSKVSVIKSAYLT